MVLAREGIKLELAKAASSLSMESRPFFFGGFALELTAGQSHCLTAGGEAGTAWSLTLGAKLLVI